MSDVNINVQFYNNEEKEKFRQNYPQFYEQFDELVANDVVIPVETFRSYAILHHLNPSLSSNLSQRGIEARKDSLLGVFDTYAEYDNREETIKAPYGTNNEVNSVSQELGNAGILSALDQSFGTQPADWTRIDIARHKDFDFKSAVSINNDSFIVAEAKGSIQEDNTKLSPISSLKSSITTKKEDETFKKNYPLGANLLIGGITVADPNNVLQLYLVDPPATSELQEGDLRRIKLIKRLSYYTSLLYFISPRSDLVKLLRERVNVLTVLSNVTVLDKLKLLNNNGINDPNNNQHKRHPRYYAQRHRSRR
jgi:hypothetical protein